MATDSRVGTTIDTADSSFAGGQEKRVTGQLTVSVPSPSVVWVHLVDRCGRPRAVFRKFGLCRICLRDLAHQGVIPGMTKSSW